MISLLFLEEKVAKTPGTRVSQVTHSSARKFCEYSSFVALLSLVSATLTTPPYRIPCGANCVCTTHDYMLAVLSICKQICSYSSIGTDTRCCSNGAGFVLTLHFAGGLHQCRGWVCQPETAVCVIPTERSDEESQPLF